MPRRPRPRPNTWTAQPDTWPDGPFRPDAPAYAAAVAGLASNLNKALARAGMTQRAAARAAGLTPSTINGILRGELIPDAATIAALEEALGEALWPGRRRT